MDDKTFLFIVFLFCLCFIVCIVYAFGLVLVLLLPVFILGAAAHIIFGSAGSTTVLTIYILICLIYGAARWLKASMKP